MSSVLYYNTEKFYGLVEVDLVFLSKEMETFLLNLH